MRDSLCERSRNPPNGDTSHVTLVGNPTKNLLHFPTKVADLALRAMINHWGGIISEFRHSQTGQSSIDPYKQGLPLPYFENFSWIDLEVDRVVTIVTLDRPFDAFFIYQF